MANTVYKGIPLELWKHDQLLSRLSEKELIELHSLMYSHIIDIVEPKVEKSRLIEANMVIGHIKDNL